jgi:hypothetical protein
VAASQGGSQHSPQSGFANDNTRDQNGGTLQVSKDAGSCTTAGVSLKPP